jgi:SAM-dependent methyltransferase
MGKRVFAYAAVSSPDGHWKPAFPKHAGILDAGCATGMYLYFLKMQGYHNIHGLEMSAKAADFGRRMGLDIRTGTISECELEPHSFDIIRLHHVLEHVPDPRGDLHKLVKALRPGGLLLLRVPVLRSVEATLLKSRWASWDPPRHIYYFTPESIGTLLKNSNLSVVKTRRDSRGHDLLKGLLVTFFGKFFDGRKSLVDSPNNPIAIVALKPAGFVLDLLRASDEMLFVARKQ